MMAGKLLTSFFAFLISYYLFTLTYQVTTGIINK